MDQVLRDGTVEAIAALERNSREGRILEVDGQQWLYAGGELTPVIWDPQPECISVVSLRGLAAYILNDAPFEVDDLLALVGDAKSVTVYGPESARTRMRPIVCKATLASDLRTFGFGQWFDQENFLISLYSMFVHDEKDFRTLVKYASHVVDEEAVTLTDDGVSQSAVLKRGLSSNEARETAPAVVTLRPYRTFREIEQPESMFIFRMRKGANGVQFALFEADGGSWILDAMTSIGGFISAQVPKLTQA